MGPLTELCYFSLPSGSQKVDPLAVCNDGTGAAFYMQVGKGFNLQPQIQMERFFRKAKSKICTRHHRNCHQSWSKMIQKWPARRMLPVTTGWYIWQVVVGVMIWRAVRVALMEAFSRTKPAAAPLKVSHASCPARRGGGSWLWRMISHPSGWFIDVCRENCCWSHVGWKWCVWYKDLRSPFKCGRIIPQLVERALAASVPYHGQQVWHAAVDLNFP